MKLLDSEKGRRALTLVDVLIVITTLALIGTFVLFAGVSRKQRPSRRVLCVNNLRQVGLAFRMWADDHGEQFPWNVPQTNGGTTNFAMSTEVWRHFEIASNEMNSPKILFCPADTQRSRANAWQPSISNGNVSYFIGLNADETRPQSILAGDRNLITNGIPASGVITIQGAMTVGWGPGIHPNGGNIAFGDGSAQQVLGVAFSKQISNRKPRFVLPFRNHCGCYTITVV